LVACNATAGLILNNTLSQPFVNEFWNIAIPTGTYRYYDGMLYMLAMLNCSGKFKIWKPACTPACATPAPTVANASINYEVNDQATQLSATGTALKWYTVETGGTASTTAPTPNTTAVGTSTHYVSQTLNGCEGPRAMITINVVASAYKIYKVTAPITIDGTLENVWGNGTSLPMEATKLLSGTVTNAADLSGFAKILWDNNYLYFMATVTDEVKQNDSQNSYDDDQIEFYLDMNNAKATTYDSDDYQYSFGWNDGTVVGSIPTAASKTNITYSAVATANGYVIEARIPWTTLQTTPAANKLLGIDFMINDDDNNGTRDGKLSWNSATDQAYQNASLFGTGKLSDIELVTGFDFESASTFSVYPNPANDFVQVEGIAGAFYYTILDMSGKELVKGSSEAEINVQSLEKGVYLLEIEVDGEKKVLKISK
jgi:hypothetical protein